VLLHDRDTYRKQATETAAYYSQGFIGDENVTEEILTATFCDEKFDHGYTGCMSLLQTCRQVYHEAAGVLYANAFLFSYASSTSPDDYYCPTNSAMMWVNDIGSQVLLVRSILIDANSSRLEQDAPATLQRDMDFLPLLRLVWVYPTLSSKTLFVHTERNSTRNTRQIYDLVFWPRTQGLPVNSLNNLTHTLGARDVLSLKRYAKFARLLPHVSISCTQRKDGEFFFGYMTFDTPRRPRREAYLYVESDILDEGVSVRSKPSERLGLMGLPDNVYMDIVEYACNSDTSFIFDLDQKVALGFDFSLLYVSQCTRSHLQCTFPWKRT